MTKFYVNTQLPINCNDQFAPRDAQVVFDLNGEPTRIIEAGEYVVMQDGIAIITDCSRGVKARVIAVLEDETLVRPAQGFLTLKTEL